MDFKRLCLRRGAMAYFFHIFQGLAPPASFLRDNRVVFNIGGNKYRLIVKINYSYNTVYIRFVGTHAEYDKINAEEI